MKPRAHNLISYSFALVIFVATLLARLMLGGSSRAALQPAALAGALMWCVHFARRASESAWVHRYSKPSVPTGDVVTEYVYYWGFAVWNAVSLTSASYREPAVWLVGLGMVVFVLAELGNARAHRMLRDLRAPGSRSRVIPHGFWFERISSPHYLFEILSWVGFALVTETWAARAFLLVGAGILGSWAHARHLAYRKDFDGLEGREKYPAERRALIPGLF
jgi:very-long-chain enoyl-CoA reductase